MKHLNEEIFPLVDSPIYQKTLLIVLGALFLGSLIVYFLRKKNFFFVYSWGSLKGWLIVAPIFFVLFGLPDPWPLIVLTLLAIFGAKAFFQIMGMYHRSLFVWLCYLGILGLSLSILHESHELYNVFPMIFWGTSLLIPFVRNNYKKMIQYIALTNMAFVFLGWAFLHLGWILKLPSGVYQFMYLIILTEFCDNTNLALSYNLGKIKLFDRIDRRRTLESTLVSVFLTLLLAFIMRFLLPDPSEIYWLTTGLVASLGGIFGDLTMTVIRKDAGIHRMGQFILGRGDFLHRMDRMIFVAPIYYYVMKWFSSLNMLHVPNQ
ncbi:MAG: phosphatidate cytidylyltransferase [Bdellovibrionaceae bacterium]|nr:phosphatidate cytidylyltransferase [Pseudobdellovibrionaceae bacterium]MDW8189908.1 phosphatidate cytidylyltransferase [Pseudobdellovibrionaceae bacterium]